MRGMWLGFIFITSLVILGFATLMKDNVLRFRQPVKIWAHFPSVQGLRTGNDVRVDGLVYGKVSEIELHPDGAGVLVTAELDKHIDLYQDAEVVVEAASILGGSTVSIKRGSKRPALDLKQPLKGTTAPGLDAIGKLASDNSANVQKALENIRTLTQALVDAKGTIGKAIQSPELHDKVVGAVTEVKDEVKKVGDSIVKLADKVGEKIDKGAGPLPAVLNDKKMTEDLQKTLENANKASEKLASIAQKLDSGEGTLPLLLNDKATAQHIKKTAENLDKATESIREITGKVANGEGTAGRFFQDDELYEKAKQTLDDIDKVFAKAARAVVEIVGESKYYNGSPVQISKGGIRISPSEDKFFQVAACFISLDKEGDLIFKEQVEDGESATHIVADIQAGYRIPWFLDRRLTIRAGLIEGKPGGAVDLRWESWGFVEWPVLFTFEGRDGYNDLKNEDLDEGIHGAMMRAYAKVPLWIRKETWFETLLSSLYIYAGVSRIGEEPEGMIGMAIEFPDDDIRTLVSLIGLAR